MTERGELAASVLHALDVARDAVDDAFHLAGASALFEEHPLQRCFRDIHAAGQHVAFGVDSRLRVARACLGLDVPPALFRP
jgi:alkylation response protein AidB-like acyl-CoA dehydrogenase